MHRTTRLTVAAVLAVLPLAACSGSVEGVASPSATSAPASPPAAAGPLDEVAGSAPASEIGGDGAELAAVAAGPDGRGVLLVEPADGPLLLAREDDEGWATTALPGLSAVDAGDTGLAVGPDGTAVLLTVTGGGGLQLTTVGADDEVGSEEVAAPAEYADVRWALGPDGSTAWLAAQDRDGAWTLLALDVAAAEVTGEQELSLGSLGAHVASVAVTPDGEQVLLTADVETDASGTRQRSVLQRFGAGLAPAGEVPLTDDVSNVGPVTADAAGTAYVALLQGGVSAAEPVLAVLAVPAGASSPTEVAGFPGLTYVRSLAVDPAGRYAYLGGLVNGSSPSALTVTTIELGGTAAAPTVVEVCSGGGIFSAAALAPAADRLVAIGQCDAVADDEDQVWIVE
ncbi:hypothetical protein [Blastococcus sp. SYSU D00820]